MNKYILQIVLLLPTILVSQLTVLNPGLEGTPGDCFITPTPWANCMPFTNFLTGGVEFTTPDTQPGCYNITLAPSEGNSYIGLGHIPNYNLINPYVGAEEWQEGFSQELSSPMIANGCPYIFTIDLANGLTADPWNGTDIATTIGEIRIFGGFDFCLEEELLWSSGPIVNENWETYTVEFIPSDNYSHILFQALKTEENALCAYLLVDNITPIVNAPPESNAGPNQEICENTTILNGNLLNVGEIGEWSIISGNAVIENINNPNTIISSLNIGETILQWTVSLDCSEQAGISQIIINVLPSPVSLAGDNVELCEDFINLNGNIPSNGDIGTWNILSGSGNIDNINNPNAIITGLSLGENILEWTVTSLNCGNATDQITLNYIESNFNINAGDNQNICEDNTNLNASTLQTNEIGQWNILLGSGTFENINEPNTIITNLGFGENILEWNISDPCNSISDTLIINVEIVELMIENISNYNGINISCENSDDGFINLVTNGGFPPYNYNWIGPNGFTSSQEDINNLISGLYTCTIIDNNGCEKILPIEIISPEPIDLLIINFNDLDCYEDAGININILGGTGVLELFITTNWGETTNLILDTNSELYFGYEDFTQWDGLINISITDQNGCSISSEEIEISTWQNPIANFTTSTYDTEILDVITFTDSSYYDAPIITWEWRFGDGNTSMDQNPTHIYTSEGQYIVCLKIIDGNNCESEICSTLNIYNNHYTYIPNIFTVNNDNINEEFLPIIRGIDVDSYSMLIYDRWGKLIFQTNNYLKGWNGKYKGHLVTQDVYSYKVTYYTLSSKFKTEIGKVTLVR